MMQTKRPAARISALLAGLGALLLLLSPAALRGAEPWEAEFDAVRAGTMQAMTLSRAELLDLVKLCDKLRPTIEALEDPPRRIHLNRLEKARNLYLYVLEVREKQAGEEEQPDKAAEER